MEIIQDIMDFFGIEMLTESATFVDVVQFIVLLAFAVFIVSYIVKLLFTVISLPDRKGIL